MSSNLNNEQESVFFYNERNVNQWKKKCEHLFGKRGKMFREVEMENFGQ